MKKWISGWGYRETDFSLFPIVVEDETQRLLFYNNLNSSQVRLRFSNRYGRHPLPIEHAAIALAREDGSVFAESTVNLTFDGKSTTILQPGETKYCDVCDFPASAGTWIAVSIYIKERVSITSAVSSQSDFVTRIKIAKGGDFCWAEDFKDCGLAERAKDFLELKPLYTVICCGVNQVEFMVEEPIRTVVVFGDSITQQGHWSESLTRPLYEAAPGKVAVVNRGICGNRVLHDASIRQVFGGYFGEGALERFEEDVFKSPGNPIDVVIVQEGINDILQPLNQSCPQYEKVSAQQMTEGYKTLASIAKKHGAVIFGCTLMPFNGFQDVWSPESEKMRTAINETLLSWDIFDGVFDYASVVCDPGDPTKLAPDYNCGDGLHPNKNGGLAIAETVDIGRILDC